MKKRNRFLEQLQRRQEQATSGSPAPDIPDTASMSDAELDAALTQARRDLLDAQHQELRERELAWVQGKGTPVSGETTETLADRLRGIQRGKRRTWR